MKIIVRNKVFKVSAKSDLYKIIKNEFIKITAFDFSNDFNHNIWKDKIHRDAVDAYKAIHSLMKSKGYKHSSGRQSASEEHSYIHPTTKKHIAINGWHGTGKWRIHKSIHSIYDKTAPKSL